MEKINERLEKYMATGNYEEALKLTNIWYQEENEKYQKLLAFQKKILEKGNPRLAEDMKKEIEIFKLDLKIVSNYGLMVKYMNELTATKGLDITQRKNLAKLAMELGEENEKLEKTIEIYESQNTPKQNWRFN